MADGGALAKFFAISLFYVIVFKHCFISKHYYIHKTLKVISKAKIHVHLSFFILFNEENINFLMCTPKEG